MRKLTTVSATDLRVRLGEMLRRLEVEDLVIEKGGMPVAVLSRYERGTGWPEAQGKDERMVNAREELTMSETEVMAKIADIRARYAAARSGTRKGKVDERTWSDAIAGVREGSSVDESVWAEIREDFRTAPLSGMEADALIADVYRARARMARGSTGTTSSLKTELLRRWAMSAGMSLLIDSDICIDAISNRNLSRIEAMRNTKPERFAISTIVYGEVSEGVFFSKTPSEDRRVWQSLLRGFEVIAFTQEIAETWAYVRGALHRGGMKTGDNDLMIAATALLYDMTVVTRNLEDFSRVPGLSLMTVARPIGRR